MHVWCACGLLEDITVLYSQYTGKRVLNRTKSSGTGLLLSIAAI